MHSAHCNAALLNLIHPSDCSNGNERMNIARQIKYTIYDTRLTNNLSVFLYQNNLSILQLMYKQIVRLLYCKNIYIFTIPNASRKNSKCSFDNALVKISAIFSF